MDGGFTVYGGPGRQEILSEMTGRACDGLQTIETVGDFLLPLQANITRIDLAVDWKADVRPAEFVSAGVSERFKSRSTIKSSTGETEYIGSQKSDIMARVYRYEPPHPRSELLRFEAVFRRQRAKDCAAWLIECLSVEMVEAQLFATFDLKHELAQTGSGQADPIPTTRNDRSAQGTVFWIYKQCVPAIARMLDADELDWDEFYQAVNSARQFYQADEMLD
jgi:DNA relaxase NicK